MVYYDPQYKLGAPTEEIGRMDSEIIRQMKCPHCKRPLEPELWYIPGGSQNSYVRSYIANGVCYRCGVTRSI